MAATAATALLLGLAPSANAASSTFDGISDDGARIWFHTTDQLVPGDTDAVQDVYERSGGETRLISTGGGTEQANFQGASTDGTIVFFTTTEPLLPATDSDSQIDVYARVNNSNLAHLSRGDVNGNGAFPATFDGASDDGLKVFFHTDEPLVSGGDGDASSRDVYRRDLGASSTAWISHPSTAHTPDNLDTDVSFAAATTDGSFAFLETTQHLTPGDTDTTTDIFRASPTATSRTSVGGNTGGDANFSALLCGVDSSGDKVFFRTSEVLSTSGDDNTNDGDSSTDIYVRDVGDATFGASLQGDGAFPASCVEGKSNSLDGANAAFESDEEFDGAAAAEADGNDADLFRYQPDYGAAETPDPDYVTGEGDGNDAELEEMGTGFGNPMIYTTDGTEGTSDADDCGGGAGCADVFHNTGASPVLRSTGPQNPNSAHPATFEAASAGDVDVLFETAAQLVASDTDSSTDAYLRDFQSSSTFHLSRGTVGSLGNDPIAASGHAARNDHYVFSTSEQLRGTDIDNDVDVYESTGGAPTQVSLEEVPPVITIGGPAITNDTTPTFTFSANEPLVGSNCRFDLGPLGGCSGSGVTPPAPLSSGGHTFEVRGSDAAGNEGTATASFTIDPNFGAATATAVNPLCATLRAKLKKLNRKIKQANDSAAKSKLKAKRRKVRKQLAALGC